MKNGLIILLVGVFLFINSVSADYLKCNSRQEHYGFICVCNDTYCDTVESPTPLPPGNYYHYMTSDKSPGFTTITGTFSNDSSFGDSSSDVFFWVNSSVQYQTFSGVGAGFTDSAGYNFNFLSAAAKQKFIESYFGESGIEYTLGRVPVAATDFSLNYYSYDNVPDDVNLEHFSLNEADFTLKFPMIKMAMNASKRGVKLLATPWTCPLWMKTNNEARPGYLLSKYYSTWANYLLKFFEAYSENGINFWGLSQGNELILGVIAHFGMPNIIMFPAQARYWTKQYLGPMLRNSNFSNIKIISLDDERPFTNWFSDRIFADKVAAQYIDGIALHWYFDSNSNINNLDNYHASYPDKILMYSESSINGGFHSITPVHLGSWDNAVRYIDSIMQTFNHWVEGYMDWNIALDEEGGPTSLKDGIHLDSPVIINVTNGEFYKQPMFYALGHFSKFITPGAKRTQVTNNQSSSDIFNGSQDVWKEKNINEVGEKIMRMNSDYSPAPPTPPTGQPGPGPTPPGPTLPGPIPPGTGPTQAGPTPPGPGPTPPGPGPTPPGPGPKPPGPPTTKQPWPPNPTVAPSTNILSLATINPDDGSHTLILYNPRADAVSVRVVDTEKGSFSHIIEANSLNTFIYW